MLFFGQLQNIVFCLCPVSIQGVSKVSEPFVFTICLKSLGARKKHHCQTKAEILKFMWVCGKSELSKQLRCGIQLKKSSDFHLF
jgi:hypothetical protein